MALTSQPAVAQTGALYGPGINLLTNPGHEHPGVYFAGRGEINVTWNWTPFWEEAPPGTDSRDPYYRTPEFRPPFERDYPDRVKSGGGSDRWFNYFALNKKAGIMQYVTNLPIGAPVRFTSWLQLWSSNDNLQPPRSTNDGNLRVRLCVDQDGGPRDMTDPNLKCSDWAQPYDQWAQLSVDAVALNSAVNALIWSSAEIPVEHNDIYADDSCFEVLPSAGAKGICMGQGFVPTGSGVTPAPLDAASIKTLPEEQAKAQTPRKPAAQPPAIVAVKAPTDTVPALAINARVSLNVRENPRTNAKVAGNAKRGAVLPVLGKSTDGRWYQVDLNGKKGWVQASLTLPNTAAKATPIIK